jgi:hypothetical protein
MSQKEKDRLAFEGENNQPVHLDLSLSKRIHIKTNEDFEREYKIATRERDEVFRFVTENYFSLINKYDSAELQN